MFCTSSGDKHGLSSPHRLRNSVIGPASLLNKDRHEMTGELWDQSAQEARILNHISRILRIVHR